MLVFEDVHDVLPPQPAAQLDPYLDAAATCFVRHGIARTGVNDLAREMGVSRTTVYRQVGPIDRVARLLLARELNRLIASLPGLVGGRTGPDAVVHLVGAVVEQARAHPVLDKVLRDEPELIHPFLATDLGAVVERAAELVAPLLAGAMDEGHLARRDPHVTAEWLARLTITLVLAPPRGDPHRFVAEVVQPLLAP